jgi:ubiquinone/menaquinone biosynthesis C-methylase UbiE
MIHPTARFSSRVENYIKFRPGYPPQVLEVLRADCGLTAASIVADIGSGTGILSEMFLKNGNPVYGVEPNAGMREAGERLLANYPNFTSVAAAAEATSLPDASMDFITAGQAFHWFERERARAEFARILKPGGWTVILWNSRRTGAGSNPFERDYEQLLQDFGTDYEAVKEKGIDLPQIRRFIGSESVKLTTLANRQTFDLEGIRGRLLSSSYTPESSHPNYHPMLDRLRAIFQAHQVDGQVAFDYDTELYWAQLPERQ